MSTPPRLRGLVDRFERAVRFEFRDRANRQRRKSETALAKLELLRAIALISQPPDDNNRCELCENKIPGPAGSPRKGS